jgi:PAS domain S-box-containing protein
VAGAEVSGALDFRDVIDRLADAVVAARGEVIVYVNNAAEKMLGWPRGELVGQPLVTIVPERLRAAHLAGVARYRATRVPRLLGKPVRVPALARDGTEVDIELTISALVDTNGADFFVASMRDLRDRVELERQLALAERLRHATRAVASLVSRLDLEHVARTTVNTLADGFGAVLARVWIANEEGNALILRASAGITPSVIGSRSKIDVASYPYKVGRVARSLEAFVKNDLRGDVEFDQEWVEREGLRSVAAFPLHTGRTLRGVFAAFFCRTLESEDVDLLQTFASMVSSAANDVTLFQKMRDAVRARDHFLSMASHELNTPITTLKLQLEGLARRGSDRADSHERLSRAQKQVDRLETLVQELLDVSRITEGRLRLSLDEVDLSALVREVADRHAVDLERAQCTLTLELAPDVTGLWDRDRIDQVFTNLLTNATKYGAGKPISVEVSKHGDRARIIVSDRGIGIAPEDQPRIFERFERAVLDGRQAGLGLGLWIVHEIVAAHGGAVRVESAAGKGATFVVELPARVQADA